MTDDAIKDLFAKLSDEQIQSALSGCKSLHYFPKIPSDIVIDATKMFAQCKLWTEEELRGEKAQIPEPCAIPLDASIAAKGE